MNDRYTLLDSLPTAEDFCRLREVSGLSPKSLAAARIGLPNSVLGVCVTEAGRTVGMGRVIGDGGTVFQIVDIAVEPGHQGQGLGKAIMARIMTRLKELAPGAYVSLIADGEARHLYAQYGFAPVAPASIGMAILLP
ncbi:MULTISPECIES: GNAT family N-acetyltransferase [unclassified Haematobacter]|uniref:GNAT family N-acetyltransferase n=1 Tax=unclassified Haematobacter TaxID=2640585 RepID=UPI0025C59B1A|nr:MULTISPECIES: GNAT family N-acetyltransferase [unclassified Haematobacter]